MGDIILVPSDPCVIIVSHIGSRMLLQLYPVLYNSCQNTLPSLATLEALYAPAASCILPTPSIHRLTSLLTSTLDPLLHCTILIFISQTILYIPLLLISFISTYMKRVGVDNYRLLEEIGEGSYGKVYRGLNTINNH